MAKLRINGDSSGYVDLEAPNAASSSTLDLDQVPQKNVANTFTANNTFSSNSYFGSEGVRLSTDGSGELGVGYGQTTTTKRFSVYNGTSNDFSISPEGYVTKPQQPSFTVKKTTAQTGLDASGGSLINWDVAMHNIGGHYNLSTKRFTAPVAGRYQFSAGGNIFHYSGSQTYYWLMKKNGAAGTYYAYTQRTDASNVWIQLVLQNTIIDLNANDYLELFCHASNSSSKLDFSATNHWSFYSGHLLG